MTKPKIHNTWMLVNKHTGAIWYSPPGVSADECWGKAQNWEEQQCGGPALGWKADMRAGGWIASKVDICPLP